VSSANGRGTTDGPDSHVAHRLHRYGAGRRLDYADITPDHLAEVVAEIGKHTAYHPVAPDGRARAS